MPAKVAGGRGGYVLDDFDEFSLPPGATPKTGAGWLGLICTCILAFLQGPFYLQEKCNLAKTAGSPCCLQLSGLHAD